VFGGGGQRLAMSGKVGQAGLTMRRRAEQGGRAGRRWAAEREARNGWRLTARIGVVVERHLVANVGRQKAEVTSGEPRTAEEGKIEQGSWGVLDGFVAATVTPGGRRRCCVLEE